jgi:xanthine dehydrogenase FAD-binding subunit
MPTAEYFAPTQLQEALRLLAERRDRITVLAGGTDLVPQLNCRKLRPHALLYVGKLGLNYIVPRNGGLAIGAATSLEDIATSGLVLEKAPILAQTAAEMGNPGIRNVATIGGNLVTASRAADIPLPLLALDAELTLVSVEHGERVIPIGQFFKRADKTVRRSDELLTEIYIPSVSGQTAFLRLGRRKVFSCGVVTAAVRVVLDGGKCTDARIVAGSMAPAPIRCPGAEGVLKGKPLTSELAVEAAVQAVGECKPIDDERASAWYRRRVMKTLIARAINQACGL